MKNPGLQLYTVFPCIKTDKDMEETIKEIKNIGYGFIQVCGSLELVAKIAPICEKYELPILGYLSDIDTLESSCDEVFEICRKYKMKDLGVSSAVSGYEATMAYINRVNNFAKKAKQNGFSFSYHNHSGEFIKTSSGQTVMELMIENFSGDVDFMPDTYWIQHGGYDVRRFIEQTKGRAKILHLKDMIKTNDGHTFAEIGEGNLWFEGIVKTAKQSGIEYYVVEQDVCEINPIESIRISFENTQKILEEVL